MSKHPTSPVPPAAEWPPCDPSSICPIVKTTLGGTDYPDLMNHRASRVVTEAESRARGWPMFWTARSCRYGHQAARWVSNPHACSDCRRVREGLPIVYDTAPRGSRAYTMKEKPAAPAPAIVVTAPVVPPAPEPDAADRRFLEALAEHRDFDRAAAAAGTTRPLIEARASINALFRKALDDLVERLGIRRPFEHPAPFAWDDAKRDLYIRTWINTGDAQVAREAVGATSSDYFSELESNREFEAAVEKARPLAASSLEDRATSLALAGNSKLLEKLLAAKKPDEFGDRLRIDVHSDNLRKLTDAQLQQRLKGLQPRNFEELAAQYGYRVIKTERAIEGEFTAVGKDEPSTATVGNQAAAADRAVSGAAAGEPQRLRPISDLI